ncbi:hypothetical protein AVEN_87890-1 [Araneus ventricosus]|uniref:Uncharacterized protein n=1 Tax=Araneus ventricosus TaxID=182803 RepID=A0A4Y2BB84_ARAVE|nr:hypothetical protein AVEN_87890-1 [Araneus ventricosus]
MESTNFTEIVQPFLHFPDHPALPEILPAITVVGKSIIGSIVFPKMVPEGGIYLMIPIIGLFYWYCTGQLWISIRSWFLMVVAMLVVYISPEVSLKYLGVFGLVSLETICSFEKGCEYMLDIFLMVCLSRWIMKFQQDYPILSTFGIALVFACPSCVNAYKKAIARLDKSCEVEWL